MAYQVIKRIKGIPYLYEQETYRVGGKVHTRSRYIGRADGSSGTGHVPASGIAEVKPPATESASQTLKLASSQTRANPKRNASGTTGPSRVNTTKIDWKKHNISERALLREHKNAVATLERAGINTDSLPVIHLKHARSVTTKRRWRDGSYVVTLPKKSSGKRTQFKRQYSAAIARASLDALASQDAERYSALASQWDKSYRATQSALTSYIYATSSITRRRRKRGFVLGLVVRHFGLVEKAREVLPDPERVGLVDYSKRSTWRDELVTVMAKRQRIGPEKMKANHRKQTVITRREIHVAVKQKKKAIPLSKTWWRARRRMQKCLAQERALKAFGEKLKLLDRTLEKWSFGGARV